MGTAEVVAAITGSMGVAAAVGSALVAGRSARRASKTTADVQNKALAVDQNDRFVQRLLERLDQLETEATSLHGRISQLRQDHDAELKRVRDDHDEELSDLRERVDHLRAEHGRATTLVQRLKEYVRQLREVIRSLGHHPPPPPAGVHVDD